MTRAAGLLALLAAVAGLVAAAVQAQERVRLQVPGSVVFQVPDLEARAAAAPTLLTFDQARLAPGKRLRISVRADGLDLSGSGAPARISFAASHARGGAGLRGVLREADYTPVFESDPLALSGSVEIAWTLEPLGRFVPASARPMGLRWRVESIPSPGDPVRAAPAVRERSGPAGSDVPPLLPAGRGGRRGPEKPGNTKTKDSYSLGGSHGE